MMDKDLALRNAIANQELEGLVVPPEEIERARKVINGEITADEAAAQIVAKYRACNSANEADEK